ncbi:hypothetical protein AYK24_09125 [Thermoplasmatales archaeon SG8-52-4]|nr:MAG: hypothetical protein AYK24_09125 [Thermoplasmatales archaeon SG8-52-4]
MNKKSLLLAIFTFFIIIGLEPGVNSAQINLEKNNFPVVVNSDPYLSTPDWVSGNPHYSTGAALEDLDLDGWLDLVVADGNDMQMGRLNVYYNNGDGTLPSTASWQSNDLGFNGHLDIADVNGDGWLDVAVSYLGTSSSFGPVARLYLNNGGTLSSLPDWESDVTGNAFGVDFGDMNNDGRPDLAVATGWSYNPQHEYKNLVYLNINGALESTASWESDDIFTYMGAHWVDADDDGWLDLAYIGAFQETYIYKNNEGTLETTASWHTTDSQNQDGIMLTSGDVDNDGIKDLFTTDNTQLSGSGYFKQYTGKSDGFFETTYSWNYYGRYGSAVTLADVNCDNTLDLATGAWWDYTNIFLNDGTGLPNNPSWTSGGTSVVEKIVFGDVGPELIEKTYTKTFAADGNRRLFYLPHQNIQRIDSVSLDGVALDSSEYTYSREHTWITVSTAPTESVEVTYVYSRSLDMVVSNWDPDIGNYLYYNQISQEIVPDLQCEGNLRFTDIPPGSTNNGTFTIENVGDHESELNWEITEYPEWGEWSFSILNGTGLTPEDGKITIEVTVVAPDEKNEIFTGNVEITNIENTKDHCDVDVLITTPKLRTDYDNLLTRLFEQFSDKVPFIKELLEDFLERINYK